MTRTILTVGDKERLSARAYEIIKNANGRSVTLPQLYNELQPLSIEMTTLRTVLKKLPAMHTDIRSTKGHGFTYEPVVEPVQSNSVVADEPSFDIHEHAGDIWKVTRSDGRFEYFLELARNDANMIGILLYHTDEDPAASGCWHEPYDINLALGGNQGFMFGNAMNIKTKPRKYAVEKFATAPDEWLEHLLNTVVAEILRIHIPEISEPEPLVDTKPVESIKAGGICYTSEDIVRLVTERDLFERMYHDFTEIMKAGRLS